ncbi:MAG: hypothetical protein IKA47_04830 [Oscillospiraceae bacterium]|nr:hypothetical protein [Oscillospiraceae bacterium]
MEAIIGMALWALIPGFIAKGKGRSFWGYYFLSFLLSPLVAMIITLCLSNLNSTKPTAFWVCASCGAKNSEVYNRCTVCGSTESKQLNKVATSWQCQHCGTENSMSYSQCKKCGNLKNS